MRLPKRRIGDPAKNRCANWTILADRLAEVSDFLSVGTTI